MSVYAKLNKARSLFHKTKLNKSGHNKLAGYKYFELGDFLIPALEIFDQVGLCATISFTATDAIMRIVNVEDDKQIIVFSSPMASANLKGCHEIQNLGAVQTYQRRYLWTSVLEIVEHDALDATTGNGNIVEETIDAVQLQELTDMINITGTDTVTMCKYYKISSLKDMPASKFNHAMIKLEGKGAKA